MVEGRPDSAERVRLGGQAQCVTASSPTQHIPLHLSHLPFHIVHNYHSAYTVHYTVIVLEFGNLFLLL